MYTASACGGGLADEMPKQDTVVLLEYWDCGVSKICPLM
jgi:hypothetical protein